MGELKTLRNLCQVQEALLHADLTEVERVHLRNKEEELRASLPDVEFDKPLIDNAVEIRDQTWALGFKHEAAANDFFQHYADAFDWEKPYLAMVASGDYIPTTLAIAGPAMLHTLWSGAMEYLEEEVLDSASYGVHVWEGVISARIRLATGKAVTDDDPFHFPTIIHSQLNFYEVVGDGRWRDLTDEEWSALREQRNPWLIRDWLKEGS